MFLPVALVISPKDTLKYMSNISSLVAQRATFTADRTLYHTFIVWGGFFKKNVVFFFVDVRTCTIAKNEFVSTMDSVPNVQQSYCANNSKISRGHSRGCV
jgi:hypothetical protein